MGWGEGTEQRRGRFSVSGPLVRVGGEGSLIFSDP